MENKKISFNKNYLDIIRELTKISEAMRFVREGDKISIVMPSGSKTLAFKIDAPASYFDFDGSEINIRYFAEFYQFINAFESISLIQTDNSFIIANKNNEINYVLSNSQIMPKIPNGITKKDGDITFILSMAELIEMTKMTGMIKADNINVQFANNKIELTAFTAINNNNYKKTFVPEQINNPTPFDFVIKSEVIAKMPVVSDYRVSFVKEGYVFLEWSKDGIDFMAISGKVRKV